MTETFAIARLGAQGDGIAEMPAGPVYIPFALPGEIVAAAREGARARLLSVIEASADRVDPACRHFTDCGGCAVQHLAPAPYLAWKRDNVAHALASRGIDIDVAGTVGVAPASRRRTVFSAQRDGTRMTFGYHRAESSTLVDIAECPVVLPAIEAALDALRRLAGLVCHTRDPFHMTVTATASGLDVAVDGAGTLPESGRRAAVEFGIRENLARLSIGGELIVEPSQPQVPFGAVAVPLPSGGFLQAVAAAEVAMAEIALGHLRRAKRIADLFSGAGTFSFRLAARAEVHAVDGDAPALAALDRAIRGATGLKRITHEKRDLFRRPLTAKELAGFDGVLFDPPRAGAEDQSKQLARSDVPYVVAVSCNPATLARDLRILIDGGYALKSVTPMDQFLWSPHVEAVALLEKPKRRR